uniref:Uncharacterized protein n=1 Tax=Meloidogyne enterolobii TaxID=390850 RepID=A0A6V7WBC8_MELEN|nr:unnamed protein product [Meloidogyne enterolobii]
MNISIFIFFFICSYFLHHIYGADKGKAKVTEYYDPPPKSSPGVSSPDEMFDPAEFDSEDEPEDTFHFSLTELSVLIRVLKTVSIEDVKDLNDLFSFIRNKTENVLEGIYERFNNDFGQKFFNNLEGIIIYHSQNYETEVEKPQIKERFILQKLLNFRLETTIEKYAEFLNNMGILPMPDDTTFDELKNDIDRLKYFAYNDEGIYYRMLHLNRYKLVMIAS